jgi:hypothetical protein
MTDATSQKISKEPMSDKKRWLLKYGDRVYGPYSYEAVVGYIAEGRIVAASIIAPEGTGIMDAAWQPANSFETFATSFAPAPQDRLVPDSPALKEADRTPAQAPAAASAATAIIQQGTTPETTDDAGKRPTYGPAKGQIDRRRQPESSNFIIVMDVKSRFTGPLEEAIMSRGPAYKIAPNVWCINADATAAGLLNDLSIHIGKTDSMFIVDATRDRTAWHNLGPETDAKIRRVWRRAF